LTAARGRSPRAAMMTIHRDNLRDALTACAVGTVIAVLLGYALADCTLPGPTNNVFPPPWPGLLGDAAGLNFPSTPGTACGNTLIGGPLLSDTEAAAQARSAPTSTVDGANRAANAYQPSPSELAAY